MSGVLPEKTEKEMHDKNETHRRLVERLRQHACDMFRMTKGLDESAFTSRPEADSWSLKELVAHIRRVQQVFASRIETMLSKDNPSLESYSAERDPEMTAMLNADGRLLVEVFLKERHALAERLEKLTPAEWHRPAPGVRPFRRALPGRVPDPSRGQSPLPDVCPAHPVREAASLAPTP